MKRSEMIDEMVCCLLAYAATYPQYPLDKLLYAVEEILKMQEKAGMLPPTRLDESEESELGGYHINEWEPEDEN